MDYYQKPETLRGDNGLFCPSCQQQTESTSIRNVYSTKNILMEEIKIVGDENQTVEAQKLITTLRKFNKITWWNSYRW